MLKHRLLVFISPSFPLFSVIKFRPNNDFLMGNSSPRWFFCSSKRMEAKGERNKRKVESWELNGGKCCHNWNDKLKLRGGRQIRLLLRKLSGLKALSSINIETLSNAYTTDKPIRPVKCENWILEKDKQMMSVVTANNSHLIASWLVWPSVSTRRLSEQLKSIIESV